MYQKEIIYIGLYRDGDRVGSAGFLKAESKGRDSRLYLKVQNVPLGISGRFPVRVYNGSGWKEINGLSIRDGGGIWEENLDGDVDGTVVQIMLSGGYMLEGRSKSAPENITQKSASDELRNDKLQTNESQESVTRTERPQENVLRTERPQESASRTEKIQEDTQQDAPRAEEKIIVTEELPRNLPKEEKTMLKGAEDILQNTPNYNLKEDKWEQILDTYENIHPYGDRRVYVKLEPKDFVILQSKYQQLVNNSFLLHGFYNYRYIILGKEKEYYLGVPGVFYEREKMVAQMFGFEAFECPGGNVRAGEFGYYLRKVEL